MKNRIKNLVLTALIADSYSLGSHWVYDEKQLKEAPLDWDTLNAPLAMWHKGKVAGDFTHFGDQLIFMYEFMRHKDSFDKEEYFSYWVDKMKNYDGYMDGATRETLENVQNNITPSGSNSSDFSIVARISPLLLVSKNEEEFLKNTEEFVNLTHRSKKALDASLFFAKLLYKILEGENIQNGINSLKDSTPLNQIIEKAISSKTKDSFTVIRDFGPACDVDDGLPGVIHLLSKYDNLKDILTQNAKAGGDTSARAMAAATIFAAQHDKPNIPLA